MTVANGYRIEPGADLEGADLRSAFVDGANFEGANVEGCVGLTRRDTASSNLRVCVVLCGIGWPQPDFLSHTDSHTQGSRNHHEPITSPVHRWPAE